MKLPKLLPFAFTVLVASLVSGALGNAHATHGAQNPSPLFQRILVQHMLLLGRGFLDLRYEHLAFEPGTNAIVLSGLRLFPPVDLAQDQECEIKIDQMVFDGTFGLNEISVGWEASGVQVPNSCFGPEARDVLTRAGYENTLFETTSMDVSYFLPDSSARLAVRTAVRDALVLSLGADFDFLWLAHPLVGAFDDTYLFGEVSQAEFTVEDLGLVRRIEPILLERAGLGKQDILLVLQTAVLQMLKIDESQPLTDAEQAFVEELSAGVSALWEHRQPLVVTVNPVDLVYSDDFFLASEGDRLSFLRPRVSNLPTALRSIIPPAEVAAALTDAASLDDTSRMKIGTALLTGDGAPRSIEAGARILLPFARDWSGEAAAILANAYRLAERYEDAYRMALIAMASGEWSGAAVADELELRMPPFEVLALQDEVSTDWPGTAGFENAVNAAVAEGDVRAIAGHARAVAAGRDVPRSFGTAYMLATLPPRRATKVLPG